MVAFPKTTGEDVAEMLCCIPPRPDRETWLRIASAVFSELPLAEGCSLLMQWSPEEQPGEYAQIHKNGLKRVGIGTLVHYAKQYGYDASAAWKHKRGTSHSLRMDRPQSFAEPVLPVSGHVAPVQEKKPLQLPRDLSIGTIADLDTLRDQRHLPYYVGLQIAIDRGLLRFGSVWDDKDKHYSWILTDQSQRVAQARRMDGQPWRGIGNAKAKTLPGSSSGWPVGTSTIWEHDAVIFAAGAPDLLAAFTVLWLSGVSVGNIGVVALMGENIGIMPEALQHFNGKHVRLVYHLDAAGEVAAYNRYIQLRDAGAAKIDIFKLTGFLPPAGGKDLNDCLTPDPLAPCHPDLPLQILEGLPL